MEGVLSLWVEHFDMLLNSVTEEENHDGEIRKMIKNKRKKKREHYLQSKKSSKPLKNLQTINHPEPTIFRRNYSRKEEKI